MSIEGDIFYFGVHFIVKKISVLTAEVAVYTSIEVACAAQLKVYIKHAYVVLFTTFIQLYNIYIGVAF